MTIETILQEELTALMNEIISNHQKNGQVATGKTISSYRVDVKAMQGELVGPAYVSTLSVGRGPAKKGGDSQADFTDNLKRWIVAKGLDQGLTPKKLEQFANFLRWYINKNGNKLFRSGEKIDIFDTPINNFKNRLKDRLATYYKSEITNQIFEKK